MSVALRFGYPVAISPSSLLELREIKAHLQKPEPVSNGYRKQVVTLSGEDSLSSVLLIAFEKGFSQFPVLTRARFGGLITENEIIRKFFFTGTFTCLIIH